MSFKKHSNFFLPNSKNNQITGSTGETRVKISAARFRDLSPFGQLFEPFGDQHFAMATWQFGYFLGLLFKMNQKLV